MYLALAISSSIGRWLLCDSHLHSLGSISWRDDNNKDLWRDIEVSLNTLLLENQAKIQDIDRIFCVNGPGAYTGLRIAASYCKGLSLSLNIPISPIPTLDLCPHDELFIPIRHQLAKDLNLTQALEKNFEFLKITPENIILEAPSKGSIVWGIQESHSEWPSEDELLEGLKKNIHNTSPFQISYGLGAKVFGKYLPIED